MSSAEAVTVKKKKTSVWDQHGDRKTWRRTVCANRARDTAEMTPLSGQDLGELSQGIMHGQWNPDLIKL